jgi:hypothetical protein
LFGRIVGRPLEMTLVTQLYASTDKCLIVQMLILSRFHWATRPTNCDIIKQNKLKTCKIFYINILFLITAICFEPRNFILRKTYCVYSYNNVCLHASVGRRVCSTTHGSCHRCMWTYHNTYITCLPKDEPTRFETCRRHHKLKINLENCACRWFVLYNSFVCCSPPL